MMLTPQNGGIPLDFDNRIGLIWFLNDADLAYAGRLCYHNGANPGFRSHLEILRDHKLGVVVLANDEQVPYEDIAKQALKLALQEKTGLTPPPTSGPAYSPTVVWDQARLDAIQGIYVFSVSLYASPVPYLTVRSVPGALEWTNPDDGTTIHIVPKANGWLSAPGSQTMEYEFSEISGRRVMILHKKGQAVLAAEYYSPRQSPLPGRLASANTRQRIARAPSHVGRGASSSRTGCWVSPPTCSFPSPTPSPTFAVSVARVEVRYRSYRSLPTGTRRSNCWGVRYRKN